VRSANQDAYGYSSEAQCFAVCDGMGGAAGGEVASRIAVETFLERLGPELTPDCAPLSTGRRIEQAVAAANRILYTRAQREQALHGMGTTLVALVLSGPATEKLPKEAGSTPTSRTRANAGAGARLSTSASSARRTRAQPRNQIRAWIAHVGDSRCYLLRAGTLRRCTRDHSLVEEQVRLGQLTPAQAAASPMRHVITRAVGVRRSVAVEMQQLEIEPGDLFLLCSDGLTRELDEMRIAELLASLPVEAGGDAHIAEALVREALAAGGGDNITCLTVHMA
jgi:serine/threonine protein phosphatase PrpC